MASTARTLTRALSRAGPAASLRATTRVTLPRQAQAVRAGGRRGYSSGPSSSGSKSGIYWGLGALAAGGAGYYYYSKGGDKVASTAEFKPSKEDYQKVYDAIAKQLVEKDDYDDGSYGPVILRLAWHSSGTYDKNTKTGGSNGATMRFDPEASHGANAGLKSARDFMEPIKAQFPWISYSDLWTLGGVCALQELGGPDVPWRPGRKDAEDFHACTPDGRLPDGEKDQHHVHDIFGRLGFTDQETVALIGAHSLGRAHRDRSGFDGPWDFSPTMFTNEFFRLLVEEKWNKRKWDGPPQYTDKGSQSLMMMPTDMSLLWDNSFRPWVELYAKDSDRFFKDFANAFVKLEELGVPFPVGPAERWVFKRSE